METLLDDIILLKQDYPQLTFTVTFDETTNLHIKGQTKEATIPLKTYQSQTFETVFVCF